MRAKDRRGPKLACPRQTPFATIHAPGLRPPSTGRESVDRAVCLCVPLCGPLMRPSQTPPPFITTLLVACGKGVCLARSSSRATHRESACRRVRRCCQPLSIGLGCARCLSGVAQLVASRGHAGVANHFPSVSSALVAFREWRTWWRAEATPPYRRVAWRRGGRSSLCPLRLLIGGRPAGAVSRLSPSAPFASLGRPLHTQLDNVGLTGASLPVLVCVCVCVCTWHRSVTNDKDKSSARSSKMQEPPIFSGDLDSRLGFWSRTLLPDASVHVKCIPDKGLGVFATKPIGRKALVACWQLRVFHQEGHENSNYAVALGKRPFVADLDASLIPHEPHNGAPRIGMLLNEPGIGEKRNCCNFFASGGHTHYVAGDVMTMELYTTRAVAEGEELTWDYGPGFKRDYPSRYTKQRTSLRNESDRFSISE